MCRESGMVRCYWALVLVLCSSLWLIYHRVDAQGCDVTIHSTEAAKNGTFQSPGWPENYGNELQCIYTFVGLPHERVRINFTKFEVKGVPPRCTHDYVDVYTQLRSLDDDLLEVELHGRYCGSNIDDIPHLFISMHHIFILAFYTDGGDSQKGFFGNYSFIDGLFTVGTPAPLDVCGQTIRSESMRTGTLLSPTYPGMYPDDIFCFYKFVGIPGERIKLTFLDFDLYSGGEHCPFDYVRIYDGDTNQDTVIDTYCGHLKGLEVFSTAHALYMEFDTKSGRLEPTKKPYLTYQEVSEEQKLQRRGFKTKFEISNNFVNLGFIKEGHHVLGTECDQRVLSLRESNGTIISPNYPRNYPPNVVCHFFIDGLVDTENLEKVKLTFKLVDLPARNMNTSKCERGQLEAYTKGQDDLEEKRPDKVYCGRMRPTPITTSDPRLLLILKAGQGQTGQGFEAQYQFITDYAIQGTPATNAKSKCHFEYLSESDKIGSFNSPRHPSNYPPDTLCIYEFFGQPNEQVRITFANFKVENRKGNCSTDYVRIYAIGAVRDSFRREEKLLGFFCGDKAPGPVVSETRQLRIELYSDHEVIKSGFRAHYEFIQSPRERCLIEHLAGGRNGGGGSAYHPNYPNKYLLNKTCDYYIGSENPRSKILLYFEAFLMEGNPATTGCAQAVLKVYTNDSELSSKELCGPLSRKFRQIVSKRNYIKMRFISSPLAVGSTGFSITWTEILPLRPDGSCDGFHCKVTGFCINSDLICNGLHNCGYNDTSDEGLEYPSYSDHGVLHIILGVAITLIVLVFIIICILHRRRKARKKKNKKEMEVRFVTRGSSSNKYVPGSDRLLLKERTERVSIL